MCPTKLGELVAVHLKYSPGAVPLRARAIAQLVIKALAIEPSETQLDIKSIATKASELAGTSPISHAEIRKALTYAASGGFVVESNSRWSLTEKTRKDIKQELERSHSRVQSILERHFPASIPPMLVKQWFNEVCTDLFERYANYWARSLCRLPTVNPLPSDQVLQIITVAAKNNSLENYVNELSSAFDSFLNSTDPRDQEHLWILGQSLFAARLISASVRADPLTSRKLSHSTWFLDTNVLLAMVLQEHRGSNEAASIGAIVRALDVELNIMPITRDEYSNLVANKKKQVMNVIAKIPMSTLAKARDDFTQTAFRQGCKNAADFELFFDRIAVVPENWGGVQITTCQDETILKACKEGCDDVDLNTIVSKAWNLVRSRKKSEPAIEHDAGLLSAAEAARSCGRNCWVISMDWTMCSLAGDRSGKMGFPSWISLGTLFQVLALDASGPEHLAQDFGRLMSDIIKNEAEPLPGTFAVQDLAWLLEIEERCAQLPEAELEKCAIKVAHARLSSQTSDDPELRLELQRIFQGARIASSSTVDTLKAELGAVRNDLQSEREISSQLRGQVGDLQGQINKQSENTDRFRNILVGMRAQTLKSSAVRKLVLNILGVSIYSGIMAGFAVWLLTHLSEKNMLLSLGVPAAIIAAGVIPLPIWIWKRVREFKNNLISARRLAEYEIHS